MLVVARHGRTAWNAQGRAQGWSDVGLDDVGRRQALDLGRELAGLVARPCLVATSDLRRAQETAGPVAAALDAPLRSSPALREVDVGAWQGLTEAEIEASDTETYRRWKEGEDVRRGGGETYAEAGTRVASYLIGLLATTDPSCSVVVVGHGRSLQYGLGALISAGLVGRDGPAPHLANAEHLVVPDWRAGTVRGAARG